MAAYRVHALMSFQEVVLFCGTGFLVCHLHTSEVSHPQKKKKVLCCTESQLGKKKNRILVLPYPSHFPFFSAESALPALGARSKLTEVTQKVSQWFPPEEP